MTFVPPVASENKHKLYLPRILALIPFIIWKNAPWCKTLIQPPLSSWGFLFFATLGPTLSCHCEHSEAIQSIMLSQRDTYRIHWIATVAMLPRDDKKRITTALSFATPWHWVAQIHVGKLYIPKFIYSDITGITGPCGPCATRPTIYIAIRYIRTGPIATTATGRATTRAAIVRIAIRNKKPAARRVFIVNSVAHPNAAVSCVPYPSD